MTTSKRYIVSDFGVTDPPATPADGVSLCLGSDATLFTGQFAGLTAYSIVTYSVGIGTSTTPDWLVTIPRDFDLLVVNDTGSLSYYEAVYFSGGWTRTWPLASALCKKSAAQTLGSTFADVTSWASGTERGDGFSFTTSTGVLTLDRAMEEMDVDFIVGFQCTSAPAPNDVEAQLLVNGTAQTPVVQEGLNSNTALSETQLVGVFTLYTQPSGRTIKIQARHSSGSGGVDVNYAVLRVSERSSRGD